MVHLNYFWYCTSQASLKEEDSQRYKHKARFLAVVPFGFHKMPTELQYTSVCKVYH